MAEMHSTIHHTDQPVQSNEPKVWSFLYIVFKHFSQRLKFQWLFCTSIELHVISNEWPVFTMAHCVQYHVSSELKVIKITSRYLLFINQKPTSSLRWIRQFSCNDRCVEQRRAWIGWVSNYDFQGAMWGWYFRPDPDWARTLNRIIAHGKNLDNRFGRPYTGEKILRSFLTDTELLLSTRKRVAGFWSKLLRSELI